MTAILGTYSDFKLVKTRSVVQVVIEVPLERAHEVTELFGLPQPGAEVLIGMARLRPGTQRIEAPANEDRPPAKLSQLAGILCNEGGFRVFLSENGFPSDSTEKAASAVRLVCGVRSRADLDTNADAAVKFRELRGQYDAWRRVPA